MANEFKLPNLGEGVDSGDVVGVSVKPGDSVTKGQSMLEIETNKAVMDVPAPANATIVSVAVKPGDKVKPGQVVVTYDSASGGAAAPAAAPAKAEAPKAAAAPSNASASGSAPSVSGSAPGLRGSAGAAPSTSGQAFVATPAPSATSANVAASPGIRKFARELGVDLAVVPGTGGGGRILEEDVKNYVKAALAGGGSGGGGSLSAPPMPDFSKWGAVEKFPLKGVRKATANGLGATWPLMPRVTQFDLADITGTEAARKKFSDSRKGQPGKVTMTILAIKAVTKALNEFPHFASSIDMAKGEVIQKKYRSIGIAVDSPNGLMVPVVRDTDHKNLAELASDVETLAEKVRSRKISLEEMQGGVFTISNLGGIGGTFFTPIVNWPEVAILGISKARQELQMVDGQIEARLMLGLSLSYDHRVIDGADGARFLKRVCEILANPFELVN
ncbi:MAG TPA: dihydrolipoamide acetyltransferase family protein [bacterium]|nr:dihydrolipoamide acetyltransferase family protein [bacterium]